MTLDNPTDIKRFHMLAQVHAMRLEQLGLKHSRGSVYAHVKRTYGLKGNRQTVIVGLQELINKL
jgi:hypothetical protein